jgi:hypothetical protein
MDTTTYKFQVGDIVSCADCTLKEGLITYRYVDIEGDNMYVVEVKDVCDVYQEKILKLVSRPENLEVPHVLGYVYRINKRLVAAGTLEDAIKVFRSHPTQENEIIEEIRLLDKELALIEKL